MSLHRGLQDAFGSDASSKAAKFLNVSYESIYQNILYHNSVNFIKLIEN